MKTVDIKGKPYVEVHERIKHFRTSEGYEGFSLTTEIHQLDEKTCVIKASISNKIGNIVATGFAREVNGDSFINKTSYVENCETSAWGRALANLGIGIDTSVASVDEVKNATLQRDKPPKTDDPPKANKMLDHVILGVETLLDCKVDRARVEELIRKNHDGRLPRTLIDVDKCVKELTVTGMKNILVKE